MVNLTNTEENSNINLKSWFSDIWDKFSNAGYQFHCYNWFIPALFPIIALLIGIYLNPGENINWKSIIIGSTSQILYFSFFTLIMNMATINKRKEDKNNDFVTSFILALIIIVSYIPYSNNYFLGKINYSKPYIIIISIFTVIMFILSIMIYSKYCENFNENEDAPEKIAKTKDIKESTMEESIESFLDNEEFEDNND